jgi:hypothetical protein
MQYAMLIYETEEAYAQRSTPENEEFWSPWRKYQQMLLESGVMVVGSPLQPASTTATTVRIRGGTQHVQDGPFADTKEQLGGFMILDVPSLDVALDWAARCPAARYGAVEIRPVADLGRQFGACSVHLPNRDA